MKIWPAVEYGWIILEKTSINYGGIQTNYGLSQETVDKAIAAYLDPIDPLTGLAKLMALLCNAKRCYKSDVMQWLTWAEAKVETLVNLEQPEFCVILFGFHLGAAFYVAGYMEQVLIHFG